MTAPAGGGALVAAARRVAAAASLAACAACSPPPRDVVPASRDVHVTREAGEMEARADGASETEERAREPSATAGYEYVARRPHGVIALAEARHVNHEAARAIVERLADELERCASGLEAEGLLVRGAARVVAIADPSGAPALNVRVAPGDDVAHNALLCIVSPVRATSLPSDGRGTPGIAIEATWGPLETEAPGARPGARDGG